MIENQNEITEVQFAFKLVCNMNFLVCKWLCTLSTLIYVCVLQLTREINSVISRLPPSSVIVISYLIVSPVVLRLPNGYFCLFALWKMVFNSAVDCN